MRLDSIVAVSCKPRLAFCFTMLSAYVVAACFLRDCTFVYFLGMFVLQRLAPCSLASRAKTSFTFVLTYSYSSWTATESKNGMSAMKEKYEVCHMLVACSLLEGKLDPAVLVNGFVCPYYYWVARLQRWEQRSMPRVFRRSGEIRSNASGSTV
eukprot:773293-Amphidinium_carterae.2